MHSGFTRISGEDGIMVILKLIKISICIHTLVGLVIYLKLCNIIGY